MEKVFKELVDATQHLEHSTTAVERTAKVSEDTAEPVPARIRFVSDIVDCAS